MNRTPLPFIAALALLAACSGTVILPEFAGPKPVLFERLTRLDCLQPKLEAAADGRVACVLLEGSATEMCFCNPGAGRQVPLQDQESIVIAAQKDPVALELGLDCFCVIPEVDGAGITACERDPNPSPIADDAPIAGFCYIDAEASPPVGDPVFVAGCAAGYRRALRTVGAGAPTPGDTLYLGCY